MKKYEFKINVELLYSSYKRNFVFLEYYITQYFNNKYSYQTSFDNIYDGYKKFFFGDPEYVLFFEIFDRYMSKYEHEILDSYSKHDQDIKQKVLLHKFKL